MRFIASKTYDFKKIKRIIAILLNNPDGIWLRKLSRDSKLSPSTVHYYLDGILSNVIDNIGARDEDGKFFGIRLIRLKNGIFSKLSEDNSEENLRKILKTAEILSNSE